ncbi:hypothetical protein ACFQV2_07305 [Actinokineospora soli]|uniref:Uncharacterized protein n=1 Tax=Actinokineospora soli TaxID=1048753 RepID=A0ABW2TJX8_9PSEU
MTTGLGLRQASSSLLVPPSPAASPTGSPPTSCGCPRRPPRPR